MRAIPDFWFEPTLWINGAWQTARQHIEIKNPANSAPLAKVGFAQPEDIEKAIAGAEQALAGWRATSAFERGNVLKRIARLLQERKDAYARLLTAEQGKPYLQAVGEIEYASSFFQWFGEAARRSADRLLPHPEPSREFIVQHLAVGVAGLITPWNFPLAQGAKKIAAALAAGCSMVWKPAEATPLVALALAPILAEAGVPAGVVQIVPGDGPMAGQAFANHAAIRVISVTGSTATGRTVMSQAAANIKRVSLELGGNAPFIVLPDADLEFVVDQLIRLKLFVSGQVCVTANRVFVHADHERSFTQLLADRLAEVRVGNGLADGIDAGPLVHAKAVAGVQRLVDQAVATGAKVMATNRSFEQDQSLTHANFFPPTLLTDVDDAMHLSQQEIFGPVIPLLRYQRLDEVIKRANATQVGLAGYVFGNDLTQCRAVASQLEVGIVGVNEWRPLKAEIPFGGVKQSGIGAEGGEEGLREFQAIQVISINKPSLS